MGLLSATRYNQMSWPGLLTVVQALLLISLPPFSLMYSWNNRFGWVTIREISVPKTWALTPMGQAYIVQFLIDLCGFLQVTPPLYASVSLPVKNQNDNTTCEIHCQRRRVCYLRPNPLLGTILLSPGCSVFLWNQFISQGNTASCPPSHQAHKAYRTIELEDSLLFRWSSLLYFVVYYPLGWK